MKRKLVKMRIFFPEKKNASHIFKEGGGEKVEIRGYGRMILKWGQIVTESLIELIFFLKKAGEFFWDRLILNCEEGRVDGFGRT